MELSPGVVPESVVLPQEDEQAGRLDALKILERAPESVGGNSGDSVR